MAKVQNYILAYNTAFTEYLRCKTMFYIKATFNIFAMDIEI